MKICVVECINIGTLSFSQGTRQLAFVTNGGNSVQMGLQRSKSACFDPGLIHIRLIKISNLTCSCFWSVLQQGCCFDQLLGALIACICHCCKDAYTRPICRYLSPLQPGAVRVFIKIVARLQRAVHISDRDPMFCLIQCWLCSGCEQKREYECHRSAKEEI